MHLVQVDCLGELQPSRQALRSSYILASNILPVLDANMETLRFLEIIHLYKASYFSGQPPATSSELARPLAALPTAVMAGIKRKFATDALEYLFDNGPSQKARRTAEESRGDEFYLTVPEVEAARLASGQRRLELRVNKPPYSIIVPGDTIFFNGAHAVQVGAVRNYVSLAIALQAETPSLLLPQGVESAHALAHYSSLASDADVRTFGVAVFEFIDRGDDQPLPLATTSHIPSDPGAAVQELLEAETMSINDLVGRLAPTHSASAIAIALDELQMDGFIYQLPNGHYAIL
ncbi:hypothetical protein, variant 1 [Aphanomyces astaci]|uniref:Uncharacterized protein n=1 Tax=Aphanomyces astaci TaxID=112090 RepID=W4GQE8_APHAT|nr:hypothetical protein, variant 1 [Aphanomyces astaci]ETV81239.1 hypothetical protein, variant 1 [Aphanomyces astaci]|eukprot:XP_009829097.1 hypothetical protein, variant 1 [Aphanomyces astaci]